jgi:hypothetical protein
LIKANEKEEVRDLPKVINPSDSICKHCQIGNKTRFRLKTNEHSTKKPLEPIHIDLCGPTRTKSTCGEKYFMLIVDDYTRLTWVYFLKEKSEVFEKFKTYKALVESEIDLKIKCLRSYIGGEFTSKEFIHLCENHSIKRYFSSLRNPQHNGVVERKNITVQEDARTMLNESKLPKQLWRDEIYTTVHILNRAELKHNHEKTLYELWFDRTSSVKHFRIFGSKCYIKNDGDNLGKFYPRSDEGILLGYSYNKKSYSCYNLRLLKIVESANVKIDDLKKSISQDIDKKYKHKNDDVKYQQEDDDV